MSATLAAPGAGGALRRRQARAAGALYLSLVVLGMLGPLTLESLVTPGDAATTAADIVDAHPLFDLSLVAWVVIVVVDVVLAVLLYELFAPAGRLLAAVSASLRAAYAVGLGALLAHLFAGHRLILGDGVGAADRVNGLGALELFADGFLAVLVLFGMHLVVMGVQVRRSAVLPAVFAPLLVLAGLGYVVDSLASLLVSGYGGPWDLVLLAPAIVAEVGLTFWLLIKGIGPAGPVDDQAFARS